MLGVQLNAIDPTSFGDLKRLARDGRSPEALRAAANQFEALFLQMVLKSMRDAVPANGLFDNDQTRLFQSLQDQQLAMNLAQGRGVGLADVIYRQLGGKVAGDASELPEQGADRQTVFDMSTVTRYTAIPAVPRRAAAEVVAAAAALAGPTRATEPAPVPATVSSGVRGGQHDDARSIPERVRAFVERTWEHAREASRATGIPAHFMIAQAALETGWGRAQLRSTDGAPTYNLFNIKAGPNWKGPVVELPVTEYANGRAYTENARFRVYGSYAEAFRDYASLLRNSPRYAGVLGQRDAAGFAQELQRAGYATDPHYADKLTRIIEGATLRNALAG
jgi:flagellar protein FlgJ